MKKYTLTKSNGNTITTKKGSSKVNSYYNVIAFITGILLVCLTYTIVVIKRWAKIIRELRKSEKVIRKQLEANGYLETWHRCRNDKIRPYSSVVCSMCFPKEDPNFNAFEEFVKLYKQNKE